MADVGELHVVESLEELEAEYFADGGREGHFGFPLFFDHDGEIGRDVVHDDGEEDVLSFFLFDHFEEVLMHVDDVAVLDSGNDAEFSIFVFGVLQDFFEGKGLVALLMAGLLQRRSTR